MRYRRMPIEVESPEELGNDTITNNLSESSVADRKLSDLDVDLDLDELVLCYGDHLGDPLLRESVAVGGAGLTPEHVIVTPGVATALFVVATSLLDRATTPWSSAPTTPPTSRRPAPSAWTSTSSTLPTTRGGGSISMRWPTR